MVRKDGEASREVGLKSGFAEVGRKGDKNGGEAGWRGIQRGWVERKE